MLIVGPTNSRKTCYILKFMEENFLGHFQWVSNLPNIRTKQNRSGMEV